ncbi:AAA family ATPase [Streptomyces sp. NPDC051219]|uniref:AAA family ATPase n=1 Tax=Streptomyces sp. NPDC051219 TaxID=3155283 RepID=UPI003422DB02
MPSAGSPPCPRRPAAAPPAFPQPQEHQRRKQGHARHEHVASTKETTPRQSLLQPTRHLWHDQTVSCPTEKIEPRAEAAHTLDEEHRGTPPRGTADRLIGRDRDLQRIRDLLGLGAGGGALLLSGEAGVGKTAVLDALAEAAQAEGTRVLRAVGVEFEANCSYSGLNQILFPFQDALGELETPFRDALGVALGFESGSPPERLMVPNAFLLLLRTLAAGDPLLLVIDDLPWLDRASAAVLGFVARRAAGIRVSFLAASRSGSRSLHDTGVLPEVWLQPLDEASADHLVSTRFPDLVASARQRLLTVAHGNPLALLELPSALSAERGPALGEVPAVLPLSQRLEAVFGSRITSLPQPSQRLLLLAALEGDGDLGVLQAASRQANDGYELDDLAPAERDQLVHIDEEARRLRFRHPLIRVAVVENSTSGERRAVHAALAHVLVDQPERRAWHLGEATLEPDENVAALLEHAARITLRRGDAVGGMRTFIRSADLTPPGPDRARRLAEAAYVGAESTGALPSAQKLLDDARHTARDPKPRSKALRHGRGSKPRRVGSTRHRSDFTRKPGRARRSRQPATRRRRRVGQAHEAYKAASRRRQALEQSFLRSSGTYRKARKQRDAQRKFSAARERPGSAPLQRRRGNTAAEGDRKPASGGSRSGLGRGAREADRPPARSRQGAAEQQLAAAKRRLSNRQATQRKDREAFKAAREEQEAAFKALPTQHSGARPLYGCSAPNTAGCGERAADVCAVRARHASRTPRRSRPGSRPGAPG